jgi:hypothetical protein
MKNAIIIEEGEGSNALEYNFNGLKSDHAYRLIKALWKK